VVDDVVILRDAAGEPQHAVLTWDGYESLRRAAKASASAVPRPPGVSGLRSWREHRGFSQAQLAQLTGISRVYLSQIETGERAGTVEVLASLARSLGCRIEDLLRSARDPFIDGVATLAGMPAVLQAFATAIPEEHWRTRIPGCAFSLLEQVCHLRDIDGDGYLRRITRIVDEETPGLPDLDGSKLAEERDYQAQDLRRVLAAFVETRAAIVERLRALSPEQRARTGRQEGVGVVTITQIVAAMLTHDSEHRDELASLRDRLGGS
jgi:transcriptional regulator with XRE-family HTH domain